MTAGPKKRTAPDEGPESNLDVVLAKVGRASTPPVKASPFGITLGSLLGVPRVVQAPAAVVLGTGRTREAVSHAATVIPGVPGALREQVAVPGVTSLVIDWAAFEGGPWLAANSHGARALSEEIFDAGRHLRASGAVVYAVPLGEMETSTDRYLLSTCTVNIGDIDPADLEEEAPQSLLWHALIDLADERLEADASRLAHAPSFMTKENR